MPITELDDDYDEDWYEDDSDDTDSEMVACPDCENSVSIISGKCPSCGHWLTDADSRDRWSAASRPLWQKLTAMILLAMIAVSILLMIW